MKSANKNKKTAEPTQKTPRYPGKRDAQDGSFAVVAMETAASEAAGAYPITPSTQMGEGWAVVMAQGKTNVNGRRLIFFEPEGEHAAAAVTAGMSMVGLRSTNFSSGQGIAYMHESLYGAVGKRLTYVLNVAARAMTKHALNVHAAHDDYHAVDDTGFFQLFAKDVQETADLNLIAHRIAELSLNPGMLAQDGFLTSHVIESVFMPERELVKEYLGDPGDFIESPTPAQRMILGQKRRRIPEMFDVDNPIMMGTVQNQDAYQQGVAAQRPFYFDHIVELTDQAFEEYAQLTGRRYARAMGYKLDDAEYVILGQGSLVPNAEAVVDYLREERGIKVGVLNLTMFRPFPSDLISKMLAGKKGVVVLERTDQPLAAEQPVLRECRVAMSQALENGRAAQDKASGGDAQKLPYPKVAALKPSDVPEFYSGCFGLGSRDLQPGDLVAAVDNMLPSGKGRRQFYLSIDFIRKDNPSPKLEVWQEELLENYPQLAELALPPAGDLNLMPEGSISLRIHSVGGWGAITMGKNVALTAFELLGLDIKANPKYGSEKKGQPTTFYATLSRDPIKLNCELRFVDVVLSPDPNVCGHSDPLAGLADGGVFVIQSHMKPEDLWRSLPASARTTIKERNLKVYSLDAFKIATEEASDPDLRYRMQGTAFMGAFFAASPLLKQEGVDEDKLFEGIHALLNKKFGHLGERVVEDNLRVIRRGFAEIIKLDTDALEVDDEGACAVPSIPALMDVPNAQPGIGNPGRFWEQVGFQYKTGTDGIADPFAAISAMPAASSSIRDMTAVRFEIPEFIPANCTGCAQCWVQCPDSAIPGLVNSVEDILDTAIRVAGNGKPLDRVKQISKHLAREARRIMKGVPFKSFGDALSPAYENVAEKLGWDPERREELDAEFAKVFARLADFPLAKTAPFFDVPESKEKGSGGLLSVTVSPETCKGCNLCVEVCPDEALITIDQNDEALDKLRRNWELWRELPDTDDRYINIANLEEGIGTLSSLLLKKDNYMSMVGGDGACMGCGQKTVVHLVISTVEALMRPRVAKYVKQLDKLIAGLDARARALLASEADIGAAVGGKDTVNLPLSDENKQRVERVSKLLDQLKDLKWRYTEGPSGKGRASLGMTNATGCSSVWASTYPFNPYPFPWVNHLFQDAPSVAIGVFEGHMRKMADGFLAVRRAELELADEYDPEVHEKEFEAFDWTRFTDEEFGLCPPIIATGGDGAMLDIGFQNLSRLLASGKPIRVLVLDTQVYSNTGGQACTSGYTGQISDMAAFGKAQGGKQEERKELSLITMAHRGAFVMQSSQASASHLIAGVLQGLQSKRPAVFNLYNPCPIEHGLADEWAHQAARFALESRAFPFLVFDPDAGDSWTDCLDLEGNPDVEADWPTYEVEYVDDEGEKKTMELPMTAADWAATEGRFRRHFKKVKPDAWDDDMVPFHEFLDLSIEERKGKVPFVFILGTDKRLERWRVSEEIVRLGMERRRYWAQIREMAGINISSNVRNAIESELEDELEAKIKALRADYEAKIDDLKMRYPNVIARRLAEGLLKAGNGERTLSDLLANLDALPGVAMPKLDAPAAPAPATAADAQEAEAAPEKPAAEPTAATAVAVEEEEEEELGMEPYIETARCTTCNECTNLNSKMFAYDENKQAYIKDPKAGTFAQLVKAAELCPVEIIHPGTPLNPKEKDLDKWIKRAERFN